MRLSFMRKYRSNFAIFAQGNYAGNVEDRAGIGNARLVVLTSKSDNVFECVFRGLF